MDIFDSVRRRALRGQDSVRLSYGWLDVRNNKLIHRESPIRDSIAFDIDPDFQAPLREAVIIAKIANLPVEFHTPTYVREASEEITNIRQNDDNPDAIIAQYNVLENVDAFQREHGIQQLQPTYLIDPANASTFEKWTGLPAPVESSHDRSVFSLHMGDVKMFGAYSSYTPRAEGGGEEYRTALTEALFVAQLTGRHVEMDISKFTLRNPDAIKKHINTNGTLNVPTINETDEASHIGFQFDAYDAASPTWAERMEGLRKWRQNQGIEPKDP